jgi:hypothetical protein
MGVEVGGSVGRAVGVDRDVGAGGSTTSNDGTAVAVGCGASATVEVAGAVAGRAEALGAPACPQANSHGINMAAIAEEGTRIGQMIWAHCHLRARER